MVIGRKAGRDDPGLRSMSRVHRLAPRTWTNLLLLGFALLTACVPHDDFSVFITNYDAERAYHADTYFQTHVFTPGYFIVDMEGNILWYRSQLETLVGHGIGLDVLENGNVLAMREGSHPNIMDPETDESLWEAEEVQGHHSLAWTPWGSVMTLVAENIMGPGLCTITSDRIVEIDVSSEEIVWEWPLHEYVDPLVENDGPDFCYGVFDYEDWSHCNTVKVIEDFVYDGQTYPAVVMLLSRNLDTFWMIDYFSQEIIWSCGQHGDFGRRIILEPLFNTAHEIEMIDTDRFLLFDNGDERAIQASRALEIEVDPVAGTANAVWFWKEPERIMFSSWGGDADRLPNGNTLITNVANGRIVEVAPNKDKVWQLDIRPPDWDLPLWLPSPISTFMAKRPAFGDS